MVIKTNLSFKGSLPLTTRPSGFLPKNIELNRRAMYQVVITPVSMKIRSAI